MIKKCFLLYVLFALGAQANDFAFKLYNQLSETEGNLFFSPASIEAALAMTAEGARGETQKQFFQCLKNKLKIGTTDFQGLDFEVANSIWVEKMFPILGTFKTAVREKHAAKIRSADFVGQPEVERKKINRWVENKTRKKIKNLLPEGSVDPMTRMVLVNAIYFKGDWLHAFDKAKTVDAPFRGAGDVPMMTMKTTKFGYVANDRFQCLELPYQGEEVSMLVFLPREETNIEDLQNELPTVCAQTLHKIEVKVFLPRFKTESTFASLKSTLIELGLTDAFDPAAADFSGISTTPLFISEVAHKAFVEVNEEGTEAAAATGMVMQITCMPMPPEVFRVDRPFVFLIRENASGKILFMGRITNPLK